jgi:hypothetical protein
MRKPRPPHRARRAHGPAAAFAGYKNVASSVARSFPSFLPSQPPQRPSSSATFMRIRPFCLESCAFPPGSPDRPRRSWGEEDRASEVRGSFGPESAIAPYSFDATEQLWYRSPHRIRLALAELRAQQCPDPLATSLAVAPSPPLCSVLRRLRGRGQGLPSLQHHGQWQKYLTMTRPGFCLAVPQVPQVDDASGASCEFPRGRSTCRIRLDCVALGWSEAAGSYETLPGAFLRGSAN